MVLVGLQAVLFSACSTLGEVILYNATDQPLVLNVVYEDFRSEDYSIASSTTGSVYLNFHVASELVIRVGNDRWCYTVESLPTAWVIPGFTRPRAHASLSGDGTIRLFSSDSDEAAFYKEAPPPQPRGFPLQPGRCPA